ncbi:vancomycin resistance protein, partial [Staphylococcus arlettae]
MKKRKSLSEIIPIWYRVAERKETIRRHVKDLV